jgi:DNA methyltransferase 1-associated protein 1
MQESEHTDGSPQACTDYAKYDIKVDLPTFNDDEYDAYLRSDDWSREETDYLMQMIDDYSYRWAVIWDRYDYQSTSPPQEAPENANGDADQALATMPFPPPRQRTVEDLKARFYDISAKLMKQRIPEVQMDAEQYSTYEMLSKFDPNMERNRKMLATALMNRSMDEVREEEFLLTELQRINMAANRLDAEREELRARLDAPPQNQSVSAGLQAFTSSQALQALFQQLFQQDRSKKRATGGGTGPGRLSLSANDMVHTPGSAQAQLSAANRRQSMASQPVAQTPVKQLSPHQEQRFNVSSHERLTSGVTFGSDKLLKMRQAKSNVQTQKIGTALAELGIADVIPIPTSKVGEVFEYLVVKLSKLLDVRKVREKEEGECRVLQSMKERGAGGTDNGTPKPKSEIADSQETPDVDGDGDNEDDSNPNYEEDDAPEDEDEDDAEGEEDDGGDDGDMNLDDMDAEGEDESSVQQSRATSQGAAGHKRSASVFSQASGQSNKRARK